MFGAGFDALMNASAPRVSVRADQLDALVDKIRAIPCTDYRCPNASAEYARLKRLCERCDALALANSIERRNI